MIISAYITLFFCTIVIQKSFADVIESDIDSGENEFQITGRVDISSTSDKDWVPNTKIFVDGGDYFGYLKNDGSFAINGIPSGSYIVEVSNPNFIFESVRVDITSKGKMRARKLNTLRPSNVKTMPYPLEFKERTKAHYFQTREQWRLTDFLFNPMVLTMVLPLLLIMVLPKMMNSADPETQKEMQTQMKALNEKSSMPDMSEMLASFFGSDTKKSSKTKSTKRRS
ncbi:hypothetical protein ScPMuIL_010509 [Solemya velum]